MLKNDWWSLKNETLQSAFGQWWKSEWHQKATSPFATRTEKPADKRRAENRCFSQVRCNYHDGKLAVCLAPGFCTQIRGEESTGRCTRRFCWFLPFAPNKPCNDLFLLGSRRLLAPLLAAHVLFVIVVVSSCERQLVPFKWNAGVSTRFAFLKLPQLMLTRLRRSPKPCCGISNSLYNLELMRKRSRTRVFVVIWFRFLFRRMLGSETEQKRKNFLFLFKFCWHREDTFENKVRSTHIQHYYNVITMCLME